MDIGTVWRRLLPGYAVVISLMLLMLQGWFGPADGTEMPGTIIIDSLKDKYGPVTFDHTMHAGLAESCGRCHHQHSEKMVAVCKECHSIEPAAFKASAKQGFLPCGACHNEYSPDAPDMPGLKVALHKKCFQCHVGIGKLGASPAGCTESCHDRK